MLAPQLRTLILARQRLTKNSKIPIYPKPAPRCAGVAAEGCSLFRPPPARLARTPAAARAAHYPRVSTPAHFLPDPQRLPRAPRRYLPGPESYHSNLRPCRWAHGYLAPSTLHHVPILMGMSHRLGAGGGCSGQAAVVAPQAPAHVRACHADRNRGRSAARWPCRSSASGCWCSTAAGV